jgi:hypothetical protein
VKRFIIEGFLLLTLILAGLRIILFEAHDLLNALRALWTH